MAKRVSEALDLKAANGSWTTTKQQRAVQVGLRDGSPGSLCRLRCPAPVRPTCSPCAAHRVCASDVVRVCVWGVWGGDVRQGRHLFQVTWCDVT